MNMRKNILLKGKPVKASLILFFTGRSYGAEILTSFFYQQVAPTGHKT